VRLRPTAPAAPRLSFLLAGPSILVLSLLLALLRPGPAFGQEAREGEIPESVPEPGASLEVFLLTMGPGEAVWERFGHNALWIRDNAIGWEAAYNWGLFSFQQENFIKRFLQGTMMYWMAGFRVDAMLNSYVADDRTIWSQELALTPAQRSALRDYVVWNAREENKYYRYDYYRDNCSTRVRDALDRVLDGRIRATTDTLFDGRTYRSITRDLMIGDVAVHTGMTLLIAQPGDDPISAWEEMFIPMELRDHLRAITVPSEAGEEVPLVASERVLYQAVGRTPPTPKPWLVLVYLVASLLAGLIVLLLGRSAGRESRAGRITLSAVGVVWSLLAGLFGVLLVLMWSVTDHWSTHWNENLFQMNPLSLVLMVLLPLGLSRGNPKRAQRVAWIIAGLAAAGFLLQALPAMDQGNGEIIALALPMHLGVALALSAAVGKED
jgi:hypothetical protein